MSDEERQIEPLSSHVLANLTVEELEQRLELQLLQMPEGDGCFINYCGVDGNCGANSCPSDCGANAGGGGGCAADCTANTPVV